MNAHTTPHWKRRALFGTYKAARALFGPRPAAPSVDPIRERALANLAAARKVGDA